ncbi:cellulose binding domain-containing protein [Micromonospora sp. SH-82]|uniref:cellulose binding domain-containing protein n=1 Tax=Micromonospora sp. SH-82 TaxID=3132938 RepID=UPI003EBA9F69
MSTGLRRRRLTAATLAACTAAMVTAGVVTAVSAQAAAGCQVGYRVTGQWQGGFTATITVKNLGDAIDGWRLGWSFPAGQAVTQAWGFTAAPTRGAVVATNVDYNAAIPTNATIEVGFNGSWNNSTNPAPSTFTLNGTTCTGSVAPTTGPATTPPTPTTPPPNPTTPPPTPGPGVPYSSTPDGFAGAAGTTGGAGGTTVTVTNQADLERYATASAAHVIRIDRAITISPYGKEISVRSDKTIVGVGRNGQIVNGGFFLGSGTSNVIIRNLTIRDTRVASDDPDDKDFDYDGIQMDTANRIWIDHNHITRMNDGAIDSRKDTTNLTVSWNIISEANKTFGIGWTENVTARMTIHHNWFRDVNSRVPSTDNVAYAHLYNNYLQNARSGNNSRGATRMVLENSYFERVTNPYYRDSGAQLRQSGNVVVDSSGRRESGGSAFDPSSFYPYALHPAAQVPDLLRTHAGPQAAIGL